MKVNIWDRVLNSDAMGAVHAEQVVNVFYEFYRENTFRAILVDSTNANTGSEGWMVAILEKYFLIIHTIGCSLHHDELPFRAFLKTWMVAQIVLQHSVPLLFGEIMLKWLTSNIIFHY